MGVKKPSKTPAGQALLHKLLKVAMKADTADHLQACVIKIPDDPDDDIGIPSAFQHGRHELRRSSRTDSVASSGNAALPSGARRAVQLRGSQGDPKRGR